MATAATKQGFRFYKSGPAGSTSAPGSRAPSRSGSPHPADGGSSSAAISTLHEASAALSSTAGPTAPAGVDPKVYHIVRRITSSTPSLLVGNGGGKASQQSRRNSVAAVTSLVLERHREYRRKDPNWVRTSVEGAVLSLGSAAANGSVGQGGGGGSPGKRRASAIPVGGGSDPRQDSVDPPAKRKRLSEPNLQPADNSGEPPERQLERSGSSGMLNAGLRSRYRDVAAREARETSDHASAASDANDANECDRDEEEMGDDGKTARDGSAAEGRAEQAASKPPAASATTPGATPKKKKRTKKTPSSRAASSSASGYPPDPLSSAPASIQPTSRPVERYADLGGMSGLLAQVRELVEYPLSRPELFLHLGVEPPRGVLLRGPPGCGKTHLAKAIAGELNVCYFQVSAPELVGGVSGESEQRVRTLFETASDSAPAIIFIDEIDAIAPKRGEGGGGGGGGKSMEKRIVAQLLTSMDSIHPRNTRNGSAVMVLGATNRPDAMDPALRRAGRFDREIVLGAPDEGAREAILRVMTREMRTDGTDMDYKVLARKTPGFVGADLRSLTKEAAVTAINRIFRGDLLGLRSCVGGEDGGDEGKEDPKGDSTAAASSERGQGGSTTVEDATPADAKEDAPSAAASADDDDVPRSNDIRSIVPLTPAQLDPLYVTMSDFLSAVPSVQPSSKREGFATVPDVSWDDVGALAGIREELTLSVLEPIRHPERFEALGLPLPAGVLLYGPPGCGKTLLAKAIANESGANFISVKGPELLDKYVGESERSVRVVFERARTSSPCIIFFDELDSLCPRRGSDGSAGGGGVSERVVNQLLTEMDGLDSRRSVFVIAATNRPELIDPAMLRPGRLDKLLYVPLPGPGDRESILRALVARGVRLSPDVDLGSVAHDPRAAGFSGADCAALLREAGLAVLRDGVLDRRDGRGGGGGGDEERPGRMMIAPHHFRYAFDHVLPSVSRKDQARYDRLRDRMARARTRGSGGAADDGEGGGSPSEQNDSSGAPERS